MEATLELPNIKRREKTQECPIFLDGKEAYLEAVMGDFEVICSAKCPNGFEKDNGYCPYNGSVPVNLIRNSQ